MIKPPFTILILKNSHHPVTIRVTMGLLLMTIVFISITVALTGFVMAYFVFHNTGDFPVAALNSPTSEYVPVQPANDVVQVKPDIHSLSVKHHKKDQTELKLSFTSMPGNEEVYIWLIVNPDADTVGEMVVYPRNPIFKGLPVDYRNGISHLSSEGNDVTITLHDETAGIALEQFRILVFSSDGRILLDRFFRENKTTKT